jgi:hypothetical protein
MMNKQRVAPRPAIQLTPMISLQRVRVASLSGHVVNFTPREVTLVHPDAVRDCMKVGAVPCDAAGVPFDAVEDDGRRDKVVASGDLRVSLVTLLMDRMIRENDVRSFDSGGVPKLEILNKTLGFDISSKERTDIWQALKTKQAAGEPLDLHPDAGKVLDILDAESKADLLLLAKDQGVPSAEVEGLSARDLRRHLLSKFQGLTSA